MLLIFLPGEMVCGVGVCAKCLCCLFLGKYMWFLILCKGIIIGLVASVPLGPIGVMCIQKTLSKSQKSGFISGLGASSADMIFATIAAFFLSVVLSFIETHIDLIKIIGGICVIIVGVNIFLKNPAVQIRRNRAKKGSLWSDFLAIFLITLTNPAFILMFVALFASFGISQDGMTHGEGVLLVAGVFIGSALWWFTLTFGVSFLRKKFRPRHLLVMNRTSGALIVVLGIVAILSVFVNMPDVSVNNMIP